MPDKKKRTLKGIILECFLIFLGLDLLLAAISLIVTVYVIRMKKKKLDS